MNTHTHKHTNTLKNTHVQKIHIWLIQTHQNRNHIWNINTQNTNGFFVLGFDLWVFTSQEQTSKEQTLFKNISRTSFIELKNMMNSRTNSLPKHMIFFPSLESENFYWVPEYEHKHRHKWFLSFGFPFMGFHISKNKPSLKKSLRTSFMTLKNIVRTNVLQKQNLEGRGSKNDLWNFKCVCVCKELDRYGLFKKSRFGFWFSGLFKILMKMYLQMHACVKKLGLQIWKTL